MSRKTRKKAQRVEADRAPAAEKSAGMVDTVKQAGAAVVETLKNPEQLVQSVRESVNAAADAVDRTLDAVRAALENADDKVARAQEWTAEKVDRLEGTLTTLRETVAAAERLVDATQTRARALSSSADQALRESGAAAAGGIAAGESARTDVGELAPETGTPVAADPGDEAINADLEDERRPDRSDPEGGGRGLL